MEKNIKSIKAENKNCIGCQRMFKDIMISVVFEDEDDSEINDFFLTQEQAVSLTNSLSKHLRYNKHH